MRPKVRSMHCSTSGSSSSVLFGHGIETLPEEVITEMLDDLSAAFRAARLPATPDLGEMRLMRSSIVRGSTSWRCGDALRDLAITRWVDDER